MGLVSRHAETGRRFEEFLERFSGHRYEKAARACLEKLVRGGTSSEVERPCFFACETHFSAGRLMSGLGGTAVKLLQRGFV